jgi:hypothetical protein
MRPKANVFVFCKNFNTLIYSVSQITSRCKKQTFIILICNNNNSLDLPVSVSYVFILNRIQQKERQIDGKTERNIKKEKERDRDRERHRDIEREKERERERERERRRERKRKREKEIQTERQKERDIERHR